MHPVGARAGVTLERAELVVPGQPVPWARAGQNGRRHYTPPHAAAHMRAVEAAWMQAGRPCVVAGPLVLSCRFFIARPAAHYRTGRHSMALRDDAPLWPAVRPDLSNYIKLVEDALNGLMWADDALIVRYAHVEKVYADGRPAATELEVSAVI